MSLLLHEIQHAAQAKEFDYFKLTTSDAEIKKDLEKNPPPDSDDTYSYAPDYFVYAIERTEAEAREVQRRWEDYTRTGRKPPTPTIGSDHNLITVGTGPDSIGGTVYSDDVPAVRATPSGGQELGTIKTVPSPYYDDPNADPRYDPSKPSGGVAQPNTVPYPDAGSTGGNDYRTQPYNPLKDRQPPAKPKNTITPN